VVTDVLKPQNLIHGHALYFYLRLCLVIEGGAERISRGIAAETWSGGLASSEAGYQQVSAMAGKAGVRSQERGGAGFDLLFKYHPGLCVKTFCSDFSWIYGASPTSEGKRAKKRG